MKTFISTSLVVIALTLSGLHHMVSANKAGAPSGNTGSPGDGVSCAKVGCHTGTATFADGIITTNIPESGYLTDETYTITVTATSPSRNRFGFQLSPQNVSGDIQGTLTLSDASRTKLTGGGAYVTHVSTSIDGVDGVNTWSFDWDPLLAAGDVTFYAAVNVGNGNGTASGDSIYVTSLTVSEDPANNPVSIESYLLDQQLIWNNPVRNQLLLNGSLVESGQLIQIFDLHGRLADSWIHTGTSKVVYDASNLTPGIYILRSGSEQNQTGQFIKL